MDKNNFSKIHNIQSVKNILKTKDKRIVTFKKNLKFKSKNYNLPKLKSELFTTTLMTKSNSNKKRNNFLTSSNLSLSDNETFNINSKDYLYKHRNIRKRILTNPNLSPIDSKEQLLTLHNSDNGEKKNNKIFYSVNTSDNINNNSKDLFLNKSSRSLNNTNSKNSTIIIKKKSMKKKNIGEKNNTIINIFNTSLNNTPNIYFFSPMITESNSRKDEIIDNNNLFNIKRNDTLFSPIKTKRTRKMLTLNMNMFRKLKNFNIKMKNKKQKKPLQKKNSFDELKIEKIKNNIMKKINFNTNKDIFNYSDGNDEKIIYFLTKKQKLKSLNTINETKNCLNFNSLSSIKNSENENSLSNIESYKNFDFVFIEEKRRKLEEKRREEEEERLKQIRFEKQLKNFFQKIKALKEEKNENFNEDIDRLLEEQFYNSQSGINRLLENRINDFKGKLNNYVLSKNNLRKIRESYLIFKNPCEFETSHNNIDNSFN
jgi:hypothetical protein